MTMINPTKRGLVSWWSFEESSGSALDSHGSSNLAVSGTIPTATGLVGNARDLEFGDSQDVFTSSSTDMLSLDGDIDVTLGVLFRPESIREQFLMTRGRPGLNSSFILSGGSNTYTNKPRFSVYYSATSSHYVDYGGTISAGNWYFILAWHDSIENTINIQVNNGTIYSTNHSEGIQDSSYAFKMGASAGSAYGWVDGRLDESFVSRRVYNEWQRAWFYNSGVGRTYAELSDVKSIGFLDTGYMGNNAYVNVENTKKIGYVKR